jgi:hypothetical protein
MLRHHRSVYEADTQLVLDTLIDTLIERDRVGAPVDLPMTDWYPAIIYAPTRVGWYEFRGRHGVRMTWWSGERWMSSDRKKALNCPVWPGDRWRGLSRPLDAPESNGLDQSPDSGQDESKASPEDMKIYASIANRYFERPCVDVKALVNEAMETWRTGKKFGAYTPHVMQAIVERVIAAMKPEQNSRQ